MWQHINGKGNCLLGVWPPYIFSNFQIRYSKPPYKITFAAVFSNKTKRFQTVPQIRFSHTDASFRPANSDRDQGCQPRRSVFLLPRTVHNTHTDNIIRIIVVIGGEAVLSGSEEFELSIRYRPATILRDAAQCCHTPPQTKPINIE